MKTHHKWRWLWVGLFAAAAVGCATRDGGLGRDRMPASAASASSRAELAKCPVMDEAMDPAISIETKDGPVYFCCKGCIKKYKADPDKYAEKVAVQKKILAGQR